LSVRRDMIVAFAMAEPDGLGPGNRAQAGDLGSYRRGPEAVIVSRWGKWGNSPNGLAAAIWRVIFPDSDGRATPHRNVDVVFRFARDSPLEGDGFEL
jgi:hypothetical protein